MMTKDERLKDRFKALADRKKDALALRREINTIAKKLQNGADFRQHRDRLQELALDSGECVYWIQEIEGQIEELQSSPEDQREARRLCQFAK